VARLEERDRKLEETRRIRLEKRKPLAKPYYEEVVRPRKKAKKAKEAAIRDAREAAIDANAGRVAAIAANAAAG
jgi:hypothetical protein